MNATIPRILSTAVGSALVVAMSGIATAQGGSPGGGINGGMNGTLGGFGGGSILWIALTILALGLGIYAIVALQRTDSDRRDETANDALSTLRVRYAQGEISDEEFEEKRLRLEDGA